MLALKNRRGSTGQSSPGGIAGGWTRLLTVWLFNMNCTALSFTSFRTLLYVSEPKLRGKGRIQKDKEKEAGRREREGASVKPRPELSKDIPETGRSVVGASWR